MSANLSANRVRNAATLASKVGTAWLMIALSGAGCSTPAPADVDAGPTDVDGRQGAQSLTVQLATDMPLPWTAADRKVTGVELTLREFRLISDVGEVMQQSISVDWSSNQAPVALPFAAAPVGMYSEVRTRLDADLVECLHIYGEFLRNGQWVPFELETGGVFTQRLNVNLVHSPGKASRIDLAAGVVATVMAVNPANLDYDDRDNVLEFYDEDDAPNDPERSAFEARMANFFTVTGTQ